MWLKGLTQHVSADQDAAKELASRVSFLPLSLHMPEMPDCICLILAQIVALRTGQAIMFAPAGLVRLSAGNAVSLGSGYMVVKSRLRITKDGGHSLLSVSVATFGATDSTSATGLRTPSPVD